MVKYVNHTGNVTGLEWLVESENDPRDDSITTLYVGNKSLPVELSAFRCLSCSSVRCIETREAYVDINDTVV